MMSIILVLSLSLLHTEVPLRLTVHFLHLIWSSENAEPLASDD